MSFGYQVLGFGSGGEAATGNDLGIFGYGSAAGGAPYLSMTNLISNSGVAATDVTGVGTGREAIRACSFN